MKTTQVVMMAKDQQFVLKIPRFSGFYNSLNEMVVDDAIQHWFADDDGEAEVPDCFTGEFSYTSEMLTEYGRLYIDTLKKLLSKEYETELDLRFESLQTSNDYAVKGDRLFATCGLKDLALMGMLANKNKECFSELVEKRCTSRSGFVSHYSSSVDDWYQKPIKEWDHNELSILLEATMTWDEESIIYDPGFTDKAYEIVYRHWPEKAGKIAHAWQNAKYPDPDDSGLSI